MYESIILALIVSGIINEEDIMTAWSEATKIGFGQKDINNILLEKGDIPSTSVMLEQNTEKKNTSHKIHNPRNRRADKKGQRRDKSRRGASHHRCFCWKGIDMEQEVKLHEETRRLLKEAEADMGEVISFSTIEDDTWRFFLHIPMKGLYSYHALKSMYLDFCATCGVDLCLEMEEVEEGFDSLYKRWKHWLNDVLKMKTECAEKLRFLEGEMSIIQASLQEEGVL